ncbi:MAG: hypothetical protein WCJ93_04030 [Methanomicrobiales archaeon]
MRNHFHKSQVKIVVICALLVVLLSTIPVIAADIDISVEGPGISNWIFTPGTTNINSTSIILNVSSISSTWTVSVKDAMDFAKTSGTVGRMAESDAGGAYTGTNVLGAAVNITGPSSLSKYTGASVVLSGSNQLIESGLAAVNSEKIHLTIRQPVAISDPVLKGGHRYQVIVTYIAFAEGGPAPVVNGIVPAEGITGSTVTVTDLSGLNFLPHSTAVLNRTGSTNINLTVTGVTTPTRMTGTLNLAGAGVGKWDVTVTNPDGGTGTKPLLFWVKYPSAPGIGSFGPPFSGGRGSTMDVGVTGQGFRSGVAVKLTKGASVIPVTVTHVTSTTIDGTITIPSGAPTGLWDLTVTNNDGQFEKINGAFTVQ